ncbi:serine hydrolase [Sphingobacterium corticibacter]|uniref:Penicillin-binding protein n=1 Tax=Sphingobacterium corticibacter TaxID=2171749 RepID=A0A2T8HL88_9SPHI|nr:serine hydrolase [Sphingobacterium corticibacter]PVH26204.1 penicillin-binding protein [Sphingobacterium corticibacter]
MRKSITITLLLLSVCFQVTQAQTKKSADWSTIDSLLEKVRADYQVAGFSVAVVHKDSLLYSKGYGYRNDEEKLPATPQTLYAIGSSTKAFTAGLVGKLFGDSLSLDDKITQHLPELRFQDGRESQVTVRDLMAHRTGLSRYDLSWYLFNTDARDSLLARVQYMKPTADLRSTWLYNNFMYLAQGMIAEKRTGKSWEDNIRTHFLKPLDMTQTNLGIADMSNNKNASRGYTVDDDKKIEYMPYYNINGMGPAGSINSSVVEMANWLKVWLNEGKYNNTQILPAKYVQEAMSSQMVIAAALPSTKQTDVHLKNYGLGWMIGSYRGHYQVEHGGNIDGFSASISFFPSDSLGIVVLTNQNGSEVPSVVRNLISDQLLGLAYVNWNRRGVQQDSAEMAIKPLEDDLKQVKGTKPSHLLADYVGQYHHPAYGQFEIRFENGVLKTHLATKEHHLEHYHYDTFALRELSTNKEKKQDDDEAQKITFHTGFDGDIKSAQLDLPESFEFTRKVSAKEVSPKDLEAYLGQYAVGNMKITITVKDNVIYMDVPGQKNYETIAQGNHNFKIKDLAGFAIRFELDESTGKASTLYAIQPNGTFAAKRIN